MGLWRPFAVILASLMAVAGCDVPLNFGPSQLMTSGYAANSDATASPAAHGGSNKRAGGPAVRLLINGEAVEAAEILGPIMSELTERAASMSQADYVAYVQRTAFQRLTDKMAEVLLIQEGSKRIGEQDNKYIDSMVRRDLRKIITTQYDGRQRRYERELEAKGQTLDDVRAQMRNEFLITRYLELNIRPKVAEPTRAELVALFRENEDRWRKPERRRMQLIDIRRSARLDGSAQEPGTDDADTARAAALAKAGQALREIRSGRDFGEVARRFSDGTHGADGGDWGFLAPGATSERLEPAVMALMKLREGETSDIIETDQSCFIVRCMELDPGLVPDFEVAQPELKDRHFRATYNRLISAKIESLRQSARFEPANLDEFLAAVLETAPVPGATGKR